MLIHILHFRFTYPAKYTSEEQTPCTYPLLPVASLHLCACSPVLYTCPPTRPSYARSPDRLGPPRHLHLHFFKHFFFKSSQRHKQRCAIIHIFLYHRQISVWERTTKPLVIAVPAWRPLTDTCFSLQTLTLLKLLHSNPIHSPSFSPFPNAGMSRSASSCTGYLGHLSASPRPSSASPILPGNAWTPEILLAAPRGVMLARYRKLMQDIFALLCFLFLGP